MLLALCLQRDEALDIPSPEPAIDISLIEQEVNQCAREVIDRNDPNWMLARMNTAQSAMKLEALDRIKPSAEEIAANPRSRSAIMRVAVRTGAPL